MDMGKMKMDDQNMNMDGMKMKMDGSPAPRGLKPAENAKFEKGSKIVIESDHMPGMKGAHGTVAGVYDSKLYIVDFMDTATQKEVKNHKYVVDQEIDGQHEVGSKVMIEADHMEGMKGAKGEIVGIVDGPAYMVNFKPTNSNMMATNHKWLSQNDLKAES
ncbi:YdhK family protein [Fructobacillus fructosus]|uniref:LysM repeat (LysM) n=1 Tax=Fructobacillus fructosus TaxID=1631 RepID=A0ABM9MW99_9LACO|nr:YdhK family protein [Fructobacillus fructosus]MBC9118610.1 DUF1541 domain-containing protein [Fructobacillus fructosus]MBD9365087.1 DUF1541 domain-containing protein [Leuconostoc mesenteroides]CAK1232975.1 LysM repeat (LysM) [Fructobacillus fructosus]CAK1244855.1 LysM repeat (LysM) [Fructobacillus fructosus]